MEAKHLWSHKFQSSQPSLGANAKFGCKEDVCVTKEVNEVNQKIKCPPNWQDSDTEPDTLDQQEVQNLVSSLFP